MVDKDTTDFVREREFADHTATVEANEVVPGRYGHAVVRDIELGDEVDRVTVDLPHGETATISLDSRPATSQSRAHAFFEWIGVEPGRQLDAIGERLPCVVHNDEDGDVWLPVFPPKRNRRTFALLRASLFLCRRGILSVGTSFDSKYGDNHTLSMPFVWFFLFWGVFAAITWYFAPFTGWLPRVVDGVVGGLVIIVLIAPTTDISTRDTYDLQSPNYDPPSWVAEDDTDEQAES